MDATPTLKVPFMTEDDSAYRMAEITELIARWVEGRVLDGTLKGPPGDRGLPGMNAVAADTAVATYLSTASSATRAALGPLLTTKNNVFNVRDYGAKGDDVVNDMASVQAAMDAASAAGGGTVFFPPGRYFIQDRVWLRSDVTITGEGATLTKHVAADGSGVRGAFFAGSTGTKAGYGSGPSRFTLRGLRFEGLFGPDGTGIGGCVLALHHCEDVLVEDCTFSQLSRPAGHRFDLQACRRVTIRNCLFEGFDTNTAPSVWYSEDIQLDFSTRGGSSFTEPNADTPAIYDGLPCTDITITNNRWTSLTVGAKTYPAASTVLGSHSAVQGMYHRRILFTDNIVGGSVTNEAAFANGRVRFMCATEVTVRGNTFDGGGNERQAAIRVHRVTSAVPVANVGISGASNESLSAHMVCWNVKIDGNSFKNFASNVASSIGVIQIEGWEGNTPHTDVSITNNNFRDNKFGNDLSANDGMTLINAVNVVGLQVTGNQATMCRRFLIAKSCTDGRASGNRVEGTNNTSMQASTSTRFAMDDNIIGGLTGSPGLLINAGTLVSATGNRVLTKSSGVVAIRVTGGASRATVEGNLVGGVGATIGRGVEISGSTTGAVVRNTTATSCTTPVFVESGSSAAVNTGTTTI